jgi:hypothetical protein
MAEHIEILVKVNAWIDKGVASLVESLNLFGGVETLDSCEGYGDDPAYVYFRCCNGSKEARPKETLTVGYRLRLEWLASEEPMAELSTQRENMPTLAAKIAELASVGPGQLMTTNAQRLAVAETVVTSSALRDDVVILGSVPSN